MSETDNDDFRGWRFDAISKEAQLERRVQELEALVARLEREVRRKNFYDNDIHYKSSIGQTHGTISNVSSLGNIGGPAVPPDSPYKAD